jgi:hypothetical protein
MSRTRMLLVAAGALLALANVAASAGAASPSPSDAPNSLHLTKDCSKFTGQPGSSCAIVSSNLEAIPVGSQYIYYGPQISNPMFISSQMVIDAGDGNTAFGYCMVDTHAEASGLCTFWAGTGTLTGFDAVVDVTVDQATGLWHLDGTYLFTPAQ